MRPLGVGLVYSLELDPLFEESNPDLSVLELEPQAFWEKIHPTRTPGDVAYLPNAGVMSRIASYSHHKLVHSVGFPVGGSACYYGDYVTPLVDAVTRLDAPWASEHLSFNTIDAEGVVEQIGFLLPPRQTRAGVATSVRNIQRLASRLPVPFAFETGVNYLQPRSDEMRDGEFFATIAEHADCGILLDLHNLWVNERNGRQRVADLLAELPLHRVWEVHVAGGMMLGEYHLDSHSDGAAAELVEMAADIIPRLANLGALIFEILPSYVKDVGLDCVRQQLRVLNELWRLRPAETIEVARRPAVCDLPSDEPGDVVEWERTLGRLAIDHPAASDTPAHRALRTDRGIGVMQTLIGEFRDGRISRAMRFTTTLLLARLGPAAVRELLRGYHASSFPDIFTSGEADRFAEYLRRQLPSLATVPYLDEVLAFEHALIRASLYGEVSRIEWSIDPSELFSALETGQVPPTVRASHFAMDIVPKG